MTGRDRDGEIDVTRQRVPMVKRKVLKAWEKAGKEYRWDWNKAQNDEKSQKGEVKGKVNRLEGSPDFEKHKNVKNGKAKQFQKGKDDEEREEEGLR
jgi:hypothetical protein